MPAMRQYCAELATAEDTWDMVRWTHARGKVKSDRGSGEVWTQRREQRVGMCDIVHARREMSWRDRA
jgi:hypothetical protein